MIRLCCFIKATMFLFSKDLVQCFLHCVNLISLRCIKLGEISELMRKYIYFVFRSVFAGNCSQICRVSNFSAITFRLTYLLDLKTTKDAKRK